jgi:hypothetical protein
MIQEYFLELDRGDYDYSINDTAQIEPTHAEDPDELYRMSGGGVEFDAVFYPDRVEIMTAEGFVRVGVIKNIASTEELRGRLESFKPHLRDGREHGM